MLRRLFVFFAFLLPVAPALSAPPLEAIVRVETVVPGDARTADVLGTAREGSGVLIDSDGLVLTVGYLMMEAREATVRLIDGRALPARIVAYDHESGFGLLRTLIPPNVAAAELGSAETLADGDALTFVSASEGGILQQVEVVSRRPFAGYWEYLLEAPVFTAPALPGFAGAALFDAQDRLVAIGSLYSADAGGRLQDRQRPEPGNMAIPIDALMPVFADLLAEGRRMADITPWTGLTLNDSRGFLIAMRVSTGGPAAKAGLRQGDAIISVNGRPTPTLEAYMRALRAAGSPGETVRVEFFRPREGEGIVDIDTIDRTDWLKLNPSY